jgi:glycosyltransferase involved in cell wall biosynthesis
MRRAARAKPDPANPVGPLFVGYSLATLAPGYVGGTESYARGLLDGLRHIDAGELRLRVIANRTAAAAYGSRVGGNAELAELPGRFKKSQLERAAAMARMRLDARRLAARVARGLDVIHYAMTIPLPHVSDLPTVVALQDVQHREHPEWFSRSELLFRRFAYDGAARRASRVVTATQHARDQIVERLGIERDRIDVIAHGIDHDRFSLSPAAGDAERLAPLALPERFLLYPANMWPHKNHERLVEALARSHDRDVHLALSGQDYGRLDALLEHARRLDVAGRVIHLGHVAADVLPALYRRAQGMIFPSLFEGFGLPLLEAMACGCPVAASDRSALPEVLGDAGLLFDATDVDDVAAAIDRLAADDRGRDAVVQVGLARALEFTWERCAAAHVRTFELAVGDG